MFLRDGQSRWQQSAKMPLLFTREVETRTEIGMEMQEAAAPGPGRVHVDTLLKLLDVEGEWSYCTG